MCFVRTCAFTAVICIPLILSGASSGFAATTSPTTVCGNTDGIRPGSGAGPVVLGMTVSEAGQALSARPQQSITTVSTPGRMFFAFWPPHAIVPMPLRVIVMDGRIVDITLDASNLTRQCQFDKGIGMASTRGNILRVLGAPDVPPIGPTAEWLIYDRLGVMFALDTSNNPNPPDSTTVRFVDIFSPNQFCIVHRERCASYKIDVP